jgi:transcriptional regulator with XRE-family HTH domain
MGGTASRKLVQWVPITCQVVYQFLAVCVIDPQCLDMPIYPKKVTIMATDQGPVVSSALLRSELVRRRRERGLTQEQVAGELEWSSSKVIRIEGGRSAITKVDLDALLDKYGVTSPDERERLQALNRSARQRGWWDDYRADLNPAFVDFLGYEAGTTFLRQFQSVVLPGILQTRAYTRAISGATIDDEDKINRVIALRVLRREKMSKRTPPPQEYYVLDEAVLRRQVGQPDDATIMPAQLRDLAARVKSDERLTVRILPFAAGAHAGMTGPFTLLEFDGGLPDILYVDNGRDRISMIVAEDPRVTEYRIAFESLVDRALPASQSIDFILAVAEELS